MGQNRNKIKVSSEACDGVKKCLQEITDAIEHYRDVCSESAEYLIIKQVVKEINSVSFPRTKQPIMTLPITVTYMNNPIIYHVKFNRGGKDYYFGSIAAIYDTLSRYLIGVSQHTLYKANLKEKPFKNDMVTISAGVLIRKKRRRRKQM